MADVTLASLDFNVIIHDEQFNEKIKAMEQEAKDLNASLSQILDFHGNGLITKEEHQSAMRRLREQFQEAQNQQRLKLQWSKETAKMANDEAINAEKVAQAQAKSNNEKKKGLILDEQAAAATKKKAEAEINATTATERKVKAERDAARAETQRQTALINQAAAEERKLTATNNRIASQRRLNSEMEREGSILRRNHRIWNDMKNVALAYFSFEGARRLITNLVRVSAEFEKQRVSLHAILQDADGAERIFAQIKELAVQSPFQFKELVTYTKQLSAFSIPMNELYDTTKMLADVSAGLGVSMDRLVLAYGQIRSASFLRGQEVRQLTEAGIPILTELAKQFEELEGHAVSAGEVFDRISKRQVTFAMVEKVFKDMTSEGGKFYQMQEVLAQTLSGKISNLTDAYQIMFSEIGEKTSGILNGTVDALRSIAENYEKIGRIIIQLVAIYGTYRAALIAVKVAEEAMVQMSLANLAGQSITKVRGLAAALQVLTQNTKAYAKIAGLVAKLNPYALAVAATVTMGIEIYKLATHTNAYKDALKATEDVVADYNKEVNLELSNLDYLFSRLRGLNAETEEYKSVKDQIINQYGEYLTDIDRENLRIKNLADIYGKLATSIKNASIEKAISMGREKIAEFESSSTSDIWGQLSKAFEKEGLKMTEGVGEELKQYILGTISGTQLSREAILAGQKIEEWAKRQNLLRTPEDVILGENKTYNVYEMRQVLARMREQSKEMSDIYIQEIGFINDALNGVKDNTTLTLDGWRKDLADIAQAAADAGANLEIAVTAESDLLEVRKQLTKEMQDYQERYEASMAAGEATDAAVWKKRIEFVERMKSRIGLTDGGSGGGALPGASDDDTKNIVQNVQSQIRVYQKLLDTYESLIQTLSDSDARAFMAALYPQYGGMVNTNFGDRIQQLGDYLLEMAMYSDDAMNAWVSFQDAMSEEQLNKYNEKVKAAAEATANYKALMNEWEDFIPSSGAIGDILRDYTKTVEKIQKLREDSLRELANSFTVTDWENPAESFVEQSNIINQKAIAAEEGALEDAKEKAKKAIESIYKEWRDVNVDFNNLSDKTISQLNKVIETINKFNFGNLKPAERNALLALIPDLEQINALIDEFKNSDIDKTHGEKTEKNVRAWKQLAKNIVSSSKALKEFAGASNNAALEGIADTITNIGELVQNMADGFRSGAELGAVIAGVTTVANIILKSATDAAKLRAELEKIKNEEFLKAIDERINSSSTIFGDSWLGKIRQIRSAVHELSQEISKVISQGKSVVQSYQPTRDFLEALQFYADQLGMTLYDSDGLFNTDTLDAIVKKYSAFLTSGNVTVVNNLVDYTKKMKDLYKQLEESVKSMFDSLSDDIADTLIESLKATGSAVTDLEDVFQSLGDSIFKSMVQSFVIDEILNKYKDEVMSWWTDETLSEAEIAERIRGFANSVKQDIDAADDRLSAMYEAFMQNSLLTVADEAEDKSTLGGGIKSITEDTANLLASYVNAIRADVAAIRQAVVAENTQALPSPTLAEYLTQIQANTYNNAVAAQAILENLQSMMTVSDGPALRVFM